jgi:hypothetical protein
MAKRREWVGREMDDGSVEIPLSQGFNCRVSVEDLGLVRGYSWHVHGKRGGLMYATTVVALERGRGGKRALVAMHRLLVGFPDGMDVDHIDGDGLNNRRANLRVCTHRQNCCSKVRGINPRRRGGYRGVSWARGSAKWQAQICGGEIKSNGERRQLHLGLFVSAEDAARAYDLAARQCFGAFAVLNFPEVGT